MKIIGTSWRLKISAMADPIYIKYLGKNGGGKTRAGVPSMKAVYWFSYDINTDNVKPITRYSLLRDFKRI